MFEEALTGVDCLPTNYYNRKSDKENILEMTL